MNRFGRAVPQWSLTSSVRKRGEFLCHDGSLDVPAMEPDLIGQEKIAREARALARGITRNGA